MVPQESFLSLFGLFFHFFESLWVEQIFYNALVSHIGGFHMFSRWVHQNTYYLCNLDLPYFSDAL